MQAWLGLGCECGRGCVVCVWGERGEKGGEAGRQEHGEKILFRQQAR